MERIEPAWGAGLDAELEDRLSGSWSLDPMESGEDPDFEAWLIARELDLDEEAEAILARAGGGW